MTAQAKISFLLETILDPESRQVCLRVNARQSDSLKPPVISSNTIIELLTQRGFGKYFIFDEMVSLIVSDLAQKLEELESGNALYKDSFETPPIAEARDACAEVEISDDYMQAFMLLTPERGGNPLNLDMAQQILKEAGVKFGINKQSLFDLLAKARESESREPIKMLVATAKQPVKGEDSLFLPLVETANERILKPQLRADGTIDMRELGNLPIVKAGEIIMQKKMFTQGQPGINVIGNEIEAEPGEDFDFEILPGSIINPKDPSQLIAECNGQPNLEGHGMKVDNVVKVSAVDLSTGNLDIDANLLVDGDITESMKVKCSGDITVGGVIESAEVEAKGNIFVGKGIVGHIPKHQGEEIQLTTHVRAGKSINAVFASYSNLQAEQEIHLDEQLLHCDSTSHGIITVGNPKTVGSQIVGGITRAYQSIETDIVGSHAGILTRFDLSGPYQNKQKEIADFEHQIDDKSNQLEALKSSYSKFTSLSKTSERQVQLDKIKNTILHQAKVIRQLEAKAIEMRKDRDESLKQMKLKVKRRVQPMVEVQIASNKFRSRRAMESGIISLDNGEVCYQAANLDD